MNTVVTNTPRAGEQPGARDRSIDICVGDVWFTRGGTKAEVTMVVAGNGVFPVAAIHGDGMQRTHRADGRAATDEGPFDLVQLASRRTDLFPSSKFAFVGADTSATRDFVDEVVDLEFVYHNWRGEVSARRVRPLRIEFAATDWHPEQQWLLIAYDVEKGAERSFAIKDMIGPAWVDETIAKTFASAENMKSADLHPDFVTPGYEPLASVLQQALDQAQAGKGKERHANGRAFLDQPIMEIGRMVGVGYQTGQAMKKAQEAVGMLLRDQPDRAVAELLGAINYMAAAILTIREDEAGEA